MVYVKDWGLCTFEVAKINTRYVRSETVSIDRPCNWPVWKYSPLMSESAGTGAG
jgi:hypothetical protein